MFDKYQFWTPPRWLTARKACGNLDRRRWGGPATVVVREYAGVDVENRDCLLGLR